MERKLIVITGGPGVGKTILLNCLNNKGFITVPEDARQIIKEQMEANGEALPWKNKTFYAELMLKASVDSYKKEVREISSQTAFFDRGILDTICYMQMENIPVSEEWNALANTYRYYKKVFILPPWEEIYETDSERKQTWEEAVFTFKKMKETYLKFGYNIIEVPKCGVEERARFVMDSIK